MIFTVAISVKNTRQHWTNVTEGSLKHIPEAAADSSPQGKEENERFSQKQENRNENTFQAAQSLLGQ